MIHPKTTYQLLNWVLFSLNGRSESMNQLIIKYHSEKLKHLSFSKSFSFIIFEHQLSSTIIHKFSLNTIKIIIYIICIKLSMVSNTVKCISLKHGKWSGKNGHLIDPIHKKNNKYIKELRKYKNFSTASNKTTKTEREI